jgi:aspartyl-tRNA(Asn)/glutamyl-tRNA(Gln) amidotransferase subunit A
MANPTMNELLFKSIEEVGDLYRKKEVSPVEITRLTLEQLYTLEPQLNAFITVFKDQAMEDAVQAEKVFLKGERAGKLTGIPVSVKDIFMTKGIRTSLGSRIMKEFVPDQDAYVYQALKKSRAIIIGKNNMLEFAYGSVHPDYGQCNNPWDVKRTAGGSSTGSASSVAAGIGFASIGTDTGGSIRVPASFCGIVGMKPTYEKICRDGIFPLSHSLDHIGPLTRTVRDNAIILEAISSIPYAFTSSSSESIEGIKIGVIRSLTDEPLQTEVLSLIEVAIDRLRQSGADIVEVEIPGIEEVEEVAVPIILSEASYYHKKWYPQREDDYSPGTFANIKEGFNVSGVNYVEALAKKQQFRETVNEAFKEVDLLVCPTVPYPATEKDPSFEGGDIDISKRTIPFNTSGHPALTISAGNTASSNLPVGIQMVGRYDDEATIYKVAQALETALGGYQAPPLGQLL